MPMSQQTLADVLYNIQAHDGADGLVFDPMTMADVTEGAERVALDALVTEVGRLKPTLNAMRRIMEAAGNTVQPLGVQISDPVKRYGGVHIAAIFEMSDGQTITVWFHNPDSTPAKLTPADELVSWKWVLNKKDITIVVAPESGSDLNLREVSRRVMRLVEKNSAAFARVNAKRVERMAEIQGLRESLDAKQSELARLHQQIEVAKVEVGERAAARRRESAEVRFLREVNAGTHDALALSELLAKIEASVEALQAADSLVGATDVMAGNAIMRWVGLDEKANG